MKAEGEMPARAAIGSGSQSQTQQGTVTAIVAGVGCLRKSTCKSRLCSTLSPGEVQIPDLAETMGDLLTRLTVA